jgi:hypothetical protein
MLKINDTVLPTPKDVDYSYNKLWSENSGRLDSGDFVGELIAIKRKYVVTFPLLSPTELALVRNACAQAFATVTITDVDGGDAVLECYFGDVTVRAYSWNGKFRYAVDCKVSMIER